MNAIRCLIELEYLKINLNKLTMTKEKKPRGRKPYKDRSKVKNVTLSYKVRKEWANDLNVSIRELIRELENM